jgi:hypothetical protein
VLLRIKRLSSFVWHPFLLTLFALLAMLVANFERLPSNQILRPLLIYLVLTGLLVILAGLWVKDWQRAGLITSLFLLLFFTYGHLYGLLEGAEILGVNIGRHRILFPLFCVLFVGISTLIVRSKGPLRVITTNLNLIALLLVLVQIIQLGVFSWQATRIDTQIQSQDSITQSNKVVLNMPEDGNLPDIYFIILDTYTRQDAYKAALGFDNSGFIADLRERGFYVADCSLSNYNMTTPSLTSSMNMQYLDELLIDKPKDVSTGKAMAPFFKYNQVASSLKQLDYAIVTLKSGFSPTEEIKTDILLSQFTGLDVIGIGGLTRYESLLLESSAGIFIFEFQAWLPKSIQYYLESPYVAHRNRILYQLDTLGELENIPSPKFVFAHILSPHTPLVFTADGQPVVRNSPFTLNADPDVKDPDFFRQGFIDQTLFINSQVIGVVDRILAQPGDPVIIIQGDHGIPSSGIWSTAILNAIRLPDGETGLYPSISSVNTFRLIFNHLFSAGLPLLVDRSCEFNLKDPTSCKLIAEPSLQCSGP